MIVQSQKIFESSMDMRIPDAKDFLKFPRLRRCQTWMASAQHPLDQLFLFGLFDLLHQEGARVRFEHPTHPFQLWGWQQEISGETKLRQRLPSVSDSAFSFARFAHLPKARKIKSILAGLAVHLEIYLCFLPSLSFPFALQQQSLRLFMNPQKEAS